MAMNPMQRKARISFLLGMFLTLIITGAIIGFLIFSLAKMKEEEKKKVFSQVYVVSQDIPSGGNVYGNLMLKKIESSFVPANAITAINMGTYVTEASTSKIELNIGTILTSDMINTDGTIESSDMRIQEYNMIVLPTELTKGQCIDIRLRLASGEDYIVLSKKYIEKTDKDTIWIKVGEDEILTMSNAIVEAYIMEGSLLYATTYLDAGTQESATPTFVAKNSVISLMNSDPNITSKAKSALVSRYTEEARRQRETINNIVNNNSDSATSSVEQGTQEEIKKQQSARQEFVQSLGL